MSAPLHRLRKDQIVWLGKNNCKAHGHRYIEHYECYLKEEPEAEEKIGYLDIEASNLDADYGIILSWCIKDGSSDTVIYDHITPNDMKKGLEDKRITESLIAAMGKFDKIVTYYGTGFDVPFIRARALINNVPFPGYGTLKHKDLYYTIKSKFKLSSRRLENACRHLLGSVNKTRIDAKYWRNAVRGDKESIAYIVDHNYWDVIDLEKLYHKCEEFGRPEAKSI